MTSTLTRRVPLGPLADLPVGLGHAFQVGDTPIAVFRSREGKVFAVEASCPHKGGPLADGMIAGDQIVCPYHTFKYDSATGKCDQPNACALKTYAVTVADGAVYVEM